MWLLTFFNLALLSFFNLALGQTVGSTERIFDFAANGRSAYNVAITAAGGDVWIAAETTTSAMFPTTPRLELWWFDGAIWTTKTLSTNRLTGGAALIYPSITTWPGSTYVYVTSKEDLAPDTVAQLEYYRQDRDNLGLAYLRQDLGAVPFSTEHGRNHLAYDNQIFGVASGRLYACWTSRVPPSTDDNLRHKQKWPSGLWSASTVGDISVAVGFVDDHCEQDFNHDGYAFTAFHSTKLGGDRIFMRLDEKSNLGWGTIAPNGGVLNIPTGSGVPQAASDFPSFSMRPLSSTKSLGVVVAESQTDQQYLLSWRCEGSTADCNEPSEWHERATNVSGSVNQPNVVVTEYGHAFAIWEGAGNDIGVAEFCYGIHADWSDVGLVPRTGISGATYTNLSFGQYAGNSVPEVAWDDLTETLHAVFVGTKSGSTRTNVLHWSATLANDLCQ